MTRNVWRTVAQAIAIAAAAWTLIGVILWWGLGL